MLPDRAFDEKNVPVLNAQGCASNPGIDYIVINAGISYLLGSFLNVTTWTHSR